MYLLFVPQLVIRVPAGIESPGSMLLTDVDYRIES